MAKQDYQKRIDVLEKECDTLKTCIDLKDHEIQELKKKIKELKKESEEMLLHP